MTFALASVWERIEALEAAVAELMAAIRCPRCSEAPPPPPRWKGDPHARDYRGPHTCGRDRWSR